MGYKVLHFTHVLIPLVAYMIFRCCLSKPASEQPKIFAHALSKAGMQFSQFLYDCIEVSGIASAAFGATIANS